MSTPRKASVSCIRPRPLATTTTDLQEIRRAPREPRRRKGPLHRRDRGLLQPQRRRERHRYESGHHPSPARAREDRRGRNDRAQLPALLEMQAAADLQGDGRLVFQHRNDQGTNACDQRTDQLGAGNGETRALRQLAGECPRLEYFEEPLLEHADPHLGMRRVPRA